MVGEAEVRVSHHNQEVSLPVFITDNVGPVLIRRDWLSPLKLDWALMKQISVDDRWTALQTADGLQTADDIFAQLNGKMPMRCVAGGCNNTPGNSAPLYSILW